MSDRTWNRLGRRRPYFLTGAVLASTALFLMPNSSAVWMAAGMLWILDASINITMEPFRAFVADKLPEEQRTLGFVMQSFFIGIGQTLANALPYLFTTLGVVGVMASGIPLSVEYSFKIGAVVFLLAVVWTVVTSKEYPPEDMTCRRQYDNGWHAYVSSLRQVRTNHSAQLKMAGMVLKALEDKTYRGAFIASPSIPWGGGPNANEPTVSGYHAVWARDLYHIATALVAIGDQAAANRALDYLFKVQQRPDGGFPQNSRVDGKPIGGGLQLDQVALPIVLALQLERTGAQTCVWPTKGRHLVPC